MLCMTHFSKFFKKAYSFYSEPKSKFKKHFLRLDGYFYCDRKNCYVVSLKFRNKRTVDLVPVKEILVDRNYLTELSSWDTCLIGMLANLERNGFIEKDCIGWKKMRRLRDSCCFIKSNSILKIKKTYDDKDGNQITVLYSAVLHKEIEIPTRDLISNRELIYALDGKDALQLGYNASECWFRSGFLETCDI